MDHYQKQEKEEKKNKTLCNPVKELKDRSVGFFLNTSFYKIFASKRWLCDMCTVSLEFISFNTFTGH